MSNGRRDAKRRAGEGRRQLGNELLTGIVFRAVAARQITTEPVRAARPMAELVQRSAVPVDRVEICLGPRHLNVVERRE